MRTIGSFLDRFKNLKAPERSVRTAIIRAVTDVIGITIKDNCIKINNESIVYISPGSTIKAAIFENKKIIISRLNNILGKDQIKDIK